MLKCLSISEKTKDSASFPVRNLTASLTYFNLKQYDKSIQYSKKAIEYGKKFNNQFVVIMGLNNLASSYSAEHQFDKSIPFFKQQLELAQKEEDLVTTSYALINLSQNYFAIQNLAGVEKYVAMLNKIAAKIPDNSILAEIHHTNALKYILKKEYPQAKLELDKGIALAKKDNLDALGNLYNTYSKFYFVQNKIKEAENFTYKYDSLQTSANVKELNFYIEDMELKYETDKKEDQIKLQKEKIEQKNMLNWLLIGGLISLFTIAILGYRNYNHRKKLQQQRIVELETEKQLLATQSLLKGQEEERTRIAKDLHDGLGGLLSGVKLQLGAMKGNLILTEENGMAFNRALYKLDESISEMRRVAHNMMPETLLKFGLPQALQDYSDGLSQQQNFSIRFEFHGLENRLEPSAEVVIYRIVQELINNAVKHSGASTIIVQLMKHDDEHINITVEDNGKGFDPKTVDSNSAGLRNIASRVKYLNGKIDIQSAPGSGTSVYIECEVKPYE